MRARFLAPLALTLPCALAHAQVPDGWFVYGAFSPARGQVGLFMSHPRDPRAPTAITGLFGDLVTSGASSVLYRDSDGALVVAERAPMGSSVDLHVIDLVGSFAMRDLAFSLGTSNGQGEVPQADLLDDGTILVAATGLTAGPLAQYLTLSYGYQGLATVDPKSGLILPVPITNGDQIIDVYNGMAVAPDQSAAYIVTYVSSTQGDVWRVPLPAGGTATLVASLPVGASNCAFDQGGDLLVTGLGTTPSALYRVDVNTGAVTPITQTNGTLNAIALEEVTGNFAVASANSGAPARSVFWMEGDGTEHLLTNPGFGTISGIDVAPNPVAFGAGTAAAGSYAWQLAPNPGGLPVRGNQAFSLTVEESGTPAIGGIVALSAGRLDDPWQLFGVDIWIDFAQLLATDLVSGGPDHTVSLPVPDVAVLEGARLFVQAFFIQADGMSFGASPGLSLAIL